MGDLRAFFQDDTVTLYHGDCLDVLRALPDASVDAVVTDPPYGLEFMGKEWDRPWSGRGEKPAGADLSTGGFATGNGYSDRKTPTYGKPWVAKRCSLCGHTQSGGSPCRCDEPQWVIERQHPAIPMRAFQEWCETWTTECLRVLKPGGHLLAFGGSRTWHRLACAVEDAGFEIRDSIAWLYGQGFPKSLDVSKAIDKRPGVMRHAEFGAMLREAMTAKGYTNTFDVAEKVIGRRTGAVANWVKYQFPEARWWPALRDLLDLDDAVWGPVIAEAERAKTGKHDDGSPIGTFVSRINGTDAPTAKDRRDVAATPDAERWQGWGTALKPAFEPIVVGRKPLAAPGINVLGMVESGLRNQGVEGAIRWTTRPASDVASQSPMPTSGSTSQQPTAATSARNASASETPPTESGTASVTAKSTATGVQPTPTRSKPDAESRTSDCETPSSTPTDPTAPAAVNPSRRSSRSTTSTAAAPSTESQSTERSTPNSAAKDSPTATESFAGIATGLSGSWATVRIDRLEDGSFVWPDGLPRSTAGGQTVAANVLEHGTGALNIDAARVGDGSDSQGPRGDEPSAVRRYTDDGAVNLAALPGPRGGGPSGRWPTNVVLDDSQAAELDRQSGESVSKAGGSSGTHFSAGGPGVPTPDRPRGGHNDSGGASRFFPTFRYEAKAPKSERPRNGEVAHPTVKSLNLMRWLVRLVTPPGGTVLEPFAGSGTTAEACVIEGFHCIAIEREADYLPLITQRLSRRTAPVEFLRATGADMGLFEELP